ncbi:MAG: discoidin domain-containing protein [Eubacteriales bacterium]|jgi:hypothetical protein
MKKTVLFLLVFLLIALVFQTAVAADEEDVFTDGGVNYPNISLNKPYTSTGSVYDNPTWTDTGTDEQPIGKFTDGIWAPNGGGDAIGCYQGANQSITIDLGEVKAIKHVATELYGLESWAIPNPANATVSLYLSEDGGDFGKVGEFSGEMTDKDGWQYRPLTITLDETVNARYVKVEFALAGAFLWSSEIAVYGLDVGSGGESSTEETSTEPDESSVVSEDTSEPASEAPSQPSTSSEQSQGGTVPTGDSGIVALAIVSVIVLAGAVVLKRR